MFKMHTLAINDNKISPPPHELNLQLHATNKVSNPYDFSITHKKIRFRSLALAPEILSTIKVYGAKPWYNESDWKESSKVKNLTTVDGGAQFELPRITSGYQMFGNCTNLTSIDLSNFDTSKVTNMSSMFGNCTNLTSIDLSNFDTSKVTIMKNLFSNCFNLATIDLSRFNTSKVTNMESLFHWNRALKSIDLSNFDTSKVTNMSYMFNTCDSLKSIDLSNFDTSNVNIMNQMFVNCFNLVTLDISNFDTSKVTTVYRMFNACRSLKTIICPNGLDCSNVTNMGEMFTDCPTFTSPLHLKNVKSSLIESGSSPDNWVINNISGTRGVHYIVDSII